jgi:hypothetical protein
MGDGQHSCAQRAAHAPHASLGRPIGDCMSIECWLRRKGCLVCICCPFGLLVNMLQKQSPGGCIASQSAWLLS